MAREAREVLGLGGKTANELLADAAKSAQARTAKLELEATAVRSLLRVIDLMKRGEIVAGHSSPGTRGDHHRFIPLFQGEHQVAEVEVDAPRVDWQRSLTVRLGQQASAPGRAGERYFLAEQEFVAAASTGTHVQYNRFAPDYRADGAHQRQLGSDWLGSDVSQTVKGLAHAAIVMASALPNAHDGEVAGQADQA